MSRGGRGNGHHGPSVYPRGLNDSTVFLRHRGPWVSPLPVPWPRTPTCQHVGSAKPLALLESRAAESSSTGAESQALRCLGCQQATLTAPREGRRTRLREVGTLEPGHTAGEWEAGLQSRCAACQGPTLRATVQAAVSAGGPWVARPWSDPQQNPLILREGSSLDVQRESIWMLNVIWPTWRELLMCYEHPQPPASAVQ